MQYTIVPINGFTDLKTVFQEHEEQVLVLNCFFLKLNLQYYI